MGDLLAVSPLAARGGEHATSCAFFDSLVYLPHQGLDLNGEGTANTNDARDYQAHRALT